MKFSNFLFPESQSPEGDYDVIEESLREAELSEELGYDVIWLAEHHFGGGCAYPDPLNFACSAELATRLQAKYYGSNYTTELWKRDQSR